MNAYIRSVTALVLLAWSGTYAACTALPAQKRYDRKMEFQEFIQQAKGLECFAITIEGRSAASPFTGKQYIHYETVVFIGREEIKSAHRVLYHTEDGFSIWYEGALVAVRYGQVRTCIPPVVESRYSAVELKAPRTGAEKAARAILDEESIPALLLCEYGLEPGKQYYGRIKTEGYHLPPRGPEGKPERKENKVLVISDRPFPNDCELTPLYRGWRY